MNLISNGFNLSFRYLVLISFFVLSTCNSVESEKAYCKKKAEDYFLLCLLNVSLAPTYFGKVEWSSAEIQSYSQAFCIAEYNRLKACPDQKSYRPHRKD